MGDTEIIRRKFFKITLLITQLLPILIKHLDYYKNYKNLENSFIEFINKTPPTGKAIICIDSRKCF